MSKLKISRIKKKADSEGDHVFIAGVDCGYYLAEYPSALAALADTAGNREYSMVFLYVVPAESCAEFISNFKEYVKMLKEDAEDADDFGSKPFDMYAIKTAEEPKV